ncbi:MAG: hypothetical protein ABS871_04145, partial [Methanobrevibacter sp.]
WVGGAVVTTSIVAPSPGVGVTLSNTITLLEGVGLAVTIPSCGWPQSSQPLPPEGGVVGVAVTVSIRPVSHGNT